MTLLKSQNNRPPGNGGREVQDEADEIDNKLPLDTGRHCRAGGRDLQLHRQRTGDGLRRGVIGDVVRRADDPRRQRTAGCGVPARAHRRTGIYQRAAGPRHGDTAVPQSIPGRHRSRLCLPAAAERGRRRHDDEGRRPYDQGQDQAPGRGPRHLRSGQGERPYGIAARPGAAQHLHPVGGQHPAGRARRNRDQLCRDALL